MRDARPRIYFRDRLPWPLSSPGRFRARTWLRMLLPWPVADLIPKGSTDCGNHDWYNNDGIIEHCYHCSVGSRPYDETHFLD